MDLIVGLGNIGEKYKHNRHNVGFLVIDEIIKDLPVSKISNKKFKGDIFKTDKYIFLKPSTFMNLSGESVKEVVNFYKPENIFVIHDDLDLKFGAIKYKFGGGHGGHNGLKSIDANIGKNYYRIRFGIGRPEKKEEVVNYVLGDFSEEELECIKKLSNKVKEAIFNFEDLNKMASLYSNKKCE